MPATLVWHPLRAKKARPRPAKPRHCHRRIVFIVPLSLAESRSQARSGPARPENRRGTPIVNLGEQGPGQASKTSCATGEVFPLGVIGTAPGKNLLDLPVKSGRIGGTG
jgi:hypothetical protein